ncbi:quinoprotein dehydrogenase-associated SoxYZ-like carrier [Chthonobacter albigriseus]|uniref:quinoprotein dehydrogenase-associated SoxYZ-like carrier n=1 Tax=Chthonobacter albigriseus TaxID=1683161 RepID=UPI0015EF5D2F|nr:quinoprotein dehydrogenase-associated SoxYZ-like carrier [Chthonobacter albigriseus]
MDGMGLARRRLLGVCGAGLLCGVAAVLPASAAGTKAVPAESETSWPDLAATVFENRPIRDGAGLIALEAPVNHPDAGAIPVVLRTSAPAVGPSRIKTLTLVVDENPAPVVATFEIGDESVLSAVETTIRVNRFSYVHLVAETEDGQLFAVARYVKGSGGCSARGVDLPEVAKKSLGEMEFAETGAHERPGGGVERTVTVGLKHPNYTGMQMNYITLHYILAHFMTDMVVSEGQKPVVTIRSGISVSENPTFKFTYATREPGEDLVADVTDSEGLRFRRSWPLGPAS